MGIFGNASVNQTFANFTVAGTRTDVYLNYICGVLILVPFIISTLVNPVVFIYKYNQPRSAASLLYMMLSASDFLTTLLRPIFLSYELLKPGLDDYISFNCTATRIFSDVYYNMFGKFSLTTTASLAIMRFIAIRFPFYRPRKKILFGAIVTFTLTSVIPFMTPMLLASSSQGKNGVYVTWLRPIQEFYIWDDSNIHVTVKINVIRSVITSIIVLVASGLTVIAMLRIKKTPNARSRNKGCITIIVMNAALLFHMIVTFKDLVPIIFDPDYNSPKTTHMNTSANLAVFLICNGPVILSAFNPLVIVLFNSQIRQFIRDTLGIGWVRPKVTVTLAEADQPGLAKRCDDTVTLHNRTAEIGVF